MKANNGERFTELEALKLMEPKVIVAFETLVRAIVTAFIIIRNCFVVLLLRLPPAAISAAFVPLLLCKL